MVFLFVSGSCFFSVWKEGSRVLNPKPHRDMMWLRVPGFLAYPKPECRPMIQYRGNIVI